MPTSSIQTNSKLPSTSTTIFSVMSQLAIEHKAINLGQGFPGFPIDNDLVSRVNEAMISGKNQYAPMPGILPLRELLSEKMKTSYGTYYHPDNEITISAGGTQAIYTAISALVHAGDEVILFAPAYDCYAPAVEINGGKVVWIETSYPDYTVDWYQVEKVINRNTKMIVVNTPQNPSSAVWSESDMMMLLSLVRNTNIIVLSDEVYEHIVFDGARHCSVASIPELAARSLIVYSFGKTLHVTGWKLGYVVGPKELMIEFRKVHQYNVFSCSTPMQYGITEFMKNPDVYNSLSSFYEKKRDRFLSKITNEQFDIKPAKGSYFQLMQFKDMKGRSDVDLAKEWTVNGGITSIPLSVFYPEGKNEGVFRFCFAKPDDVLDSAAEKINLLGK
jgi:methionine aminotransferase